jgi:uncharacterized protein (TIRG00374 family)
MTQAPIASGVIGRVLAYAVAAALLALFFANADWASIREGVRSAGWALGALAIVVRLVSLVVAALRWQAMLQPAADVPLPGVLMVTMMGVTASAVVPLQAAEFVRPYLMSRRYGVALPATLATTMAEWILDAFALMALFIPALAWQRATARSGGGTAWFAPAVILFAAALIAMTMLPRVVQRAIASCRWPRFAAALRACEPGLRALQRPRDVVRIGAYSLLVAALTAVSAWLTLTAFHLPLSFAAGFLLLGLITVAGMIPTPGAIGGFHAVCQLGLVMLFHIDRRATVLPVLALHAVLYVPAALIGAACFLLAAGAPQRSNA